MAPNGTLFDLSIQRNVPSLRKRLHKQIHLLLERDAATFFLELDPLGE
jgi:hypothetical protein